MLVVLQISSYLVRQRKLPSDRVFTSMILFTSLACGSETISFIADGKVFTGAHAIAVISNSLSYAINITISFLWCMYVDLRLYKQQSRLKKYYTWLAMPTILLLLALLPNMKFGYFFSFDANNVYSRRPLGYIYYLSVFLYLALSVCVRYRYYKDSAKARFFPIWMFLMPVIIGTTAQMVFYGISLAWCSVAIGLVGTHMSLQNELSYIDPLTQLYNRNYLDHVLADISRKGSHMGGIMIDIDFFKSINDMYGHAVGDEALIHAAEIIRNAKPAKSISVRYAGDEFIILAKAENEFDLMNIENSLRKQLDKFNSSGKTEYKLSFSLGSALFSEKRDIDSFLNEMDDKMYSEKRLKHCRSTA
jgi:diguanylate cyclase (GGDEF)-like protein